MRTVTAFFDDRAEAEAARTRLTQSNIDVGRVQVIDQSQTQSSGSTGSTPGAGSSPGSGSSEGGGFWSSIKSAFLPQEDSYAYEEGMRRGGYLVCAQVYENEADEAIEILESGGSVDFDQRQDQWRSEGWSGYTGAASGDMMETAGMGLAPGGSTASPSLGQRATGERSETVEEERIPLIEEELRVGKREVAKGGAKVRSYVREIPVHEQVSLREEHVSVERRPVDQRLDETELASGDLLRERTVEMTETSEEAVVGKEARIREELVLKKTAEQRTEQIDDTVRRTEVDVDEGMRSGSEDRSAFGFKEGKGGTGGSTGGSGATGFDSKDPTPEGAGYTDRIDKSGL